MITNLSFPATVPEEVVFQQVKDEILKNGFTITYEEKRPWGGFYYIDESQAEKFINIFFPGHSLDDVKKGRRLLPKILMTRPHQKISWQYHQHRSEIWRIVSPEMGIITSNTDQETPMKVFKNGERVEVTQGTRHRWAALDNWGLIAEIWQHTDPNNPSNEDDVVRLQDDFGR